MKDLFHILADLEENQDIHISRLLILINCFAGKNGNGKIKGLTKLAKLDFLLRYPVYLERALQTKNKDTSNLSIANYERRSVESKMVRYRFGPWDYRYRMFINLLVGIKAVWVKVEGKTVNIGITEEGQKIANKLIDSGVFTDTNTRSTILKRNFDIGAKNLMMFIYETFPELSSMRYGKEIGHHDL